MKKISVVLVMMLVLVAGIFAQTKYNYIGTLVIPKIEKDPPEHRLDIARTKMKAAVPNLMRQKLELFEAVGGQKIKSYTLQEIAYGSFEDRVARLTWSLNSIVAENGWEIHYLYCGDGSPDSSELVYQTRDFQDMLNKMNELGVFINEKLYKNVLTTELHFN